MEISKATVGVIAAACVAAGAGGAYLASRGSTGETALLATEVATSSAPETPTAAAPAPLAETRRDAPAPPRTEPSVGARTATRSGPAGRATAPPVTRTPATTSASSSGSSGSGAVQPAEPQPTSSVPVPERVSFPQPSPVAETAPLSPEFEDLVVEADSVIGLQIENSTTSETAEVEDEVVARVTRDVRVDGRVAIPSGSQAYGEVTLVERGGRLRERARLGVRFTSVVLTDGTRIPMATEMVYREGDAPGRESAAKIGGGAIGGAIIGGILGGAKGAAIGGSLGAGAGTAATLAGGRNAATLPSGTPVTIRLAEPLTVTVER